MRKIVEDQRLIYKCCKLYHEEGLNQQQIADQLMISRVSVCRMLKIGREQGMVIVRVLSPDRLQYSRLEQKLEQLYGLKEAVVVENSPLDTRFDHMTAIGRETNKLLEAYLRDGDIIGISMGMTLHSICCSPRAGMGNISCTFVPILGGISAGRSSVANIHSNQIALEFARLYGAEYVEFFAPAIFSDTNVLHGFMREKPIQKILRYYEKIKTVIMGIGIPDRGGSTMVKAGYITEEELNNLVKEGVVGDLSLQFFDINGDTSKYHSFNNRVAGMPLSQLRSVKNKIGIGGGLKKADAIYGALQGEYINILVTDEECALRLIEMGGKKRFDK